MKKLMILFSLLIFPLFIYAQNGLVKSYFPGGGVESEINFADGIREGMAVFYFENGNIKEERNYVNGRVEGLVKIYTEEGILKEMMNIEDGKRVGPTSLFNEKGEYIADVFFENGKKLIQPVYESYEPAYEYASSEPVVETKKVNNNQPRRNSSMPIPPDIKEEADDDPAYYLSVEIMPEPYGGWDNLYKRVRYPSEARKRKIEGTVKLRAYIERNGDVNEVEILEDLGYGTGEAARTAVYYARFKPGLLKGKPSRVQMIIPVEFKLN
jgi:TonB family protein